MRVRSKLADVEFRFGAIERRDDELVIHSHPDQPMKSRVHVSPADVVTAVGRFATSPAAWGFLLRLPWFLWRARRRNEHKAQGRRP
jgi:hypothetical protein